MQSLRAKVLFVQSLIFGLIFGSWAQGATLISVNNSADSDGPIQTYDFTIGKQVNSFVPDGAANQKGRGIAIQSNEIFYTEIPGTTPGGGIHVAPYGTAGYGGHDVRILPNPRPTSGIQALAFHNGALYALTGYPVGSSSDPLAVYELDPTTGSVIAGPISIDHTNTTSNSDGFVVLTNGNFLINDDDSDPVYREYDGTTGNLVSGGLFIDLSTLSTNGFTAGTGACLAPDAQSLYFCVNFDTVIQTDLTGQHLLASQQLGPVNTDAFEGLAVVQTASCDVYARDASVTNAGSSFEFNAFGPAGSAWNVYSSSNLINWTLIGGLTMDSGGNNSFTDNTISGVPYRFYKLSDSNCCSQAIGFTRVSVGTGTLATAPGTNSMIANQLDAAGGNTLDNLFNVGGGGTMPDGTPLPDGAVILKWDVPTQAYVTNTWNGSLGLGWRDRNGNDAGNVTLNPGEGGFLYNVGSNALTVTFVGLVREGSLSTPLATQYQIISAMVPKQGLISTDLGYFPDGRAQILEWNGPAIGFLTSSYAPATHTWDVEPLLKVGQSVFRYQRTNDDVWQMNFSPCQ